MSGLSGLKIWVCALGCRSNLYDGDAIAGELAERGAVIAERPEGCQAAVIVSCSVTATADKKCRQAVRRARRELDRASDRGAVAVCGCWAQGLDAGEARSLGVNILAGSRSKSVLPDALEAFLTHTPLESEGERGVLNKRDSQGAMPPERGTGRSPGAVNQRSLNNNDTFHETFIDLRTRKNSDAREWDALSLQRPLLHTRAFLKVQEGCDHFCSYCVIPFLRGQPASRPTEDALNEARRLVGESGCKEIVLTGIHLGMYGRDIGTSLAALVRRVSEIPGLARLRLGSLEPFALDGELLNALAESPAFCPHLHLPLQSGDDGILARMRRGYTADDFLRVCDRAREKSGGGLHISSDVLVGFPGESGEAHRRTLALMRKAGLGRVHVFPYSPRKGTEAFGFADRVPSALVSARASEAAALGGELLNRYASRFTGHEIFVLAESLAENGDDQIAAGYTRNFIAAEIELKTKTESEIQSDTGHETLSSRSRPSRAVRGQEIRARAAGCNEGKLRGIQI